MRSTYLYLTKVAVRIFLNTSNMFPKIECRWKKREGWTLEFTGVCIFSDNTVFIVSLAVCNH